MARERPSTQRKNTRAPNRRAKSPAPKSSHAPKPALEADQRNKTEEPEFLDIVDETSADSFPASDPPNWATGQQRQSDDAEPEAEPAKRQG